MVKTISLLMLCLSWGISSEIHYDNTLDRQCLTCHKNNQIPSELIYRKYLLKYSTKSHISKAMKLYLQHPRQEKSTLPQQFFLKFPIKAPTNLDDDNLSEAIELFIDYYDIKKRLYL